MANYGRISVSLKVKKDEQKKIKEMIDLKRVPLESNELGYYQLDKEDERCVGCFIEQEQYDEDGKVFISFEGKWHMPTYLIDELINIGFKDFTGWYFYEMEFWGDFEVKNGVFKETSRETMDDWYMEDYIKENGIKSKKKRVLKKIKKQMFSDWPNIVYVKKYLKENKVITNKQLEKFSNNQLKRIYEKELNKNTITIEDIAF